MDSVTFVNDDPADRVDGVRVPVAPGGRPLKLKVTGAGKVAPFEGPSAKVYVAIPPGTTVCEALLLPPPLPEEPEEPEMLRL
jgi:hypothetical protein